MPQEQVTVVIPAYRAAESIERAVLSVFAQPGVSCRVIVVVDDEEGTTEAALAALDDERLTVLTNPGNMGAQKSRNRGLAAVESDWVMFLDSDDFVMGDLLPSLVQALEQGTDVAFGPWLLLDESRGRAERHQERYVDAADLLDRWLVRRQWTPPCAVLWRTAFLRGIGGWKESVRRNQDGEVVCRALLAGARPGHSTRGCGVYVQHDSPHRISQARSTFGDLIAVAESLLEQPTEAVEEARRRKILGDYFYWLADSAFRRGDREQGRRARQRAVELGGSLPMGSRLPRLGAAVLGLETYRRAVSWATKP
jgi:glycosyltransferase involved in cell wall biosynthesis